MISTEKIRNVCILAHSNAGKTSLCEAMLHKAGLIDRIGNTADGNTVSDYDAEEAKRGFFAKKIRFMEKALMDWF